MKYKNVKIAIFVLCILFLGCINKVKEPMLIKEKERRVELLNNDSIYIQECLSISETEKPLSEKRYALLLNIASHYIKTEQNDIKKHEGLNCKIPIIIWIIISRSIIVRIVSIIAEQSVVETTNAA